MKKIVLLLAFVSITSLSMAQNLFGGAVCVPDASLPDTAVGVFPLPYDDTQGEDPIPGFVTIGAAYEFTFTAIVPEEIPFEVTPGNEIQVTLEYVSIATTGAITGLPDGISYVCEPSDCVFNGGTSGCVKLLGTVDAGVAPGEYDLIIAAEVKTGLFPTAIPANFPPQPGDTFEDALPNGRYTMVAGTSSVSDALLGKMSVGQNQPNPFSSVTTFEIESKVNESFQFNVYNVLGSRVHSEVLDLNEGTQTHTFDGSSLASGIYIYAIENAEGAITGRMVINR